MERNFTFMLSQRWQMGMFACVGLDPDLSKIPSCCNGKSITETLLNFCCGIVDATHDIVAAYKPNIAFFEGFGPEGLAALKKIAAYIREHYPFVPVILDAKRADIDSTNLGYVRSAAEYGVDAMTLHPYLGCEAMKPFLDNKDLGCIVLCRTSNKGAGEFQDQLVLLKTGQLEDLLWSGKSGDEVNIEQTAQELDWDSPIQGHYLVPMYQVVAMRVATEWNRNGNCALVVGATYVGEMRKVRRLVRDLPLLIPGVGKQGGDAIQSAAAGCDSQGQGFTINNSRGVIYAGSGEDFAQKARAEVVKMNRLISRGCTQEVLARQQAIITGSHFVYTAGDHGDAYVNKDIALTHPVYTDVLASAIALEYKDKCVDVVVGPAVAGAIFAHEVARALTRITGKVVLSAYADSDGEGKIIKRGYGKLVKGSTVLVVEDILNTGKSARLTVEAVRAAEGTVAAVAAICNRGDVTAQALGSPELYSLMDVSMSKYPADQCPLCKEGVPVSTELGHGKAFLEAKAATAENA